MITTQERNQIEERFQRHQIANRVIDMYTMNHQTMVSIRREIEAGNGNEILEKALELAEATNQKCEAYLYPEGK